MTFRARTTFHCRASLLTDRVSSPLRRPDAFDFLHEPLGNGGIDLLWFLLCHPVGSIDLCLFEVLALRTHVCHDLWVVRCGTGGVICGVDLLGKSFGQRCYSLENHVMLGPTKSTGNSRMPSFFLFSSVYARLAAWLRYQASPGQKPVLSIAATNSW